MSTVKLPFHGLATLQSRYANWQRGLMKHLEKSSSKQFEPET